MAHHTIKAGYLKLVDRLNRFPQGAPPSELLFKILQMLFSEKEVELVSLMPIKPFTAKKASLIWKMNLTSTQKVLNELAGRAILVDIEQNGESVYALPPPMAGFFEFALMRVRNDIDQELFTQGQTQLGRTFVHEPALSEENALHVLDYERATEVIKSATHWTEPAKHRGKYA